jgi:Ras-related protein Rab-28
MSSKNENENIVEEDEDEVKSFQFKVILLGDGAVGKTSIAMRFSDDRFSQVYKQTVGVDFFLRRISIPPNNEISIQLWDIGGQSIGSKMIMSYISGANAILLCYDITNLNSFANLEDWYRLVTKTFPSGQVPYTVLIGNKNDLRHLTAVKLDQHNRFAEENEFASFLMSAKSGDQVRQAFWKIGATLAGLPLSKNEIDLQNTVIPATIVDYAQHDEEVNEGKVPEFTRKRERHCIIS